MSGRHALFLDRDGTVIRERNYLADPAGVELLPGAATALRAFADADYALVIVTNQSGIARGLFTRTQFDAVQQRVNALLRDAGVHLDGVFLCPHHPDFTGECECRKPKIGMYREAAEKLALSLRDSIYVGDRIADALPAQLLGGHGYLVRTGHELPAGADLPVDVQIVADLNEMARLEGVLAR
jgi:histidinol-phosphate phosphatase family protein